MARRVTRLGAAAFVLGMSLAVPPAVSGANTPDDESPTGPANVSPASAGRQARAARPAAPVSDTASPAAPDTTRTVQRAAAATRSGDDGAASRTRAARTAATADTNPAMITAAAPDRAGTAVSGAVTPSAVSVAGTAVPVAVSVPIAVSVPVAVSPEPATAPAAPARVAAIGIPPAAATTNSVMDVLGGALAPIQSFVEGIVLLVRRTFFNQAPTVAPVQTTGQTSGIITGTVGAVDPEGDAITYSVIAGPAFGTVAIAPDGSYTYTPGAGFAGTDTFTVAAADSGLHINLLNLLRPAYTLGNAIVTQGLTGPRIQFDFVYAGGAALWSQDARTALESAATILGSYFAVPAPVTLTYTVTGEMNPLAGTLASATSDIISSRSGFFRTVVQQKVITGFDANGATPDGEITWNFGSPWGFGNKVDNGLYDF